MAAGRRRADRIVSLEAESSRLKPRAEQIAAQLLVFEEAVDLKRTARREAAWLQLMPQLEEGITGLAAAVEAYDTISNQYRRAYDAAVQAGLTKRFRTRFRQHTNHYLKGHYTVLDISALQQARHVARLEQFREHPDQFAAGRLRSVKRLRDRWPAFAFCGPRRQRA